MRMDAETDFRKVFIQLFIYFCHYIVVDTVNGSDCDSGTACSSFYPFRFCMEFLILQGDFIEPLTFWSQIGRASCRERVLIGVARGAGKNRESKTERTRQGMAA